MRGAVVPNHTALARLAAGVRLGTHHQTDHGIHAARAGAQDSIIAPQLESKEGERMEMGEQMGEQIARPRPSSLETSKPW